jgi:proteasome lid subunit RPN8/RPN11
MILIKRNVIETIIEAAKNTYPKEFFALLGSTKKGIIDELVVVPAIYGYGHTLIRSGLIPVDFNIIGSVHSHPGHSSAPSKADLSSFANFGRIHLIIAWPFNMDTIEVYDVTGKKHAWRVIE